MAQNNTKGGDAFNESIFSPIGSLHGCIAAVWIGEDLRTDLVDQNASTKSIMD